MSLFALACGAALITAGAGCGGGGSSLPVDAGSGGHTSSGGNTGSGGAVFGGFGGSMPGGMGGSGMGGASMGGASMGGSGMGGLIDAGTDMINVCADASAEGGPGDSDFDGTPDCQDGCPTDPAKTTPGVCGCGISDTDSDGDGVLDCNDKCPGSPDTDLDNDGVLDCLDACPHDATRTTAGVCGCGIPENTPLCLVHRYSFNDTTNTIADSITIAGVSPKNGTGSTATTIPVGGKLALAGGTSNVLNGQWVTLPSGTISTLGNNATFEAWIAWTPANAAIMWTRIFDFGNSNQAAGTPGTGVTYLFLTPFGGASVVRTAISLAGGGGAEDLVDGTASLPTTATPLIHIAVVVDDAHLTMTLYINGQPNGTPATLRGHSILSELKDVNNWLGRSQYAPDQLFQGSYEEFRIYSSALSAAQIAANFAAGPNTVSPAVTPDGGTPIDAGTPDASADAPSGQ